MEKMLPSCLKQHKDSQKKLYIHIYILYICIIYIVYIYIYFIHKSMGDMDRKTVVGTNQQN